MARLSSSGLQSRLLRQTALTQESVTDGQTFIQSALQNIQVVGAPAFVFGNNFVRLLNFGRIQTEGAEAAVLVTGQNADIVNFRTGVIDADNGIGATASGIEVTGSARIRNFGSIDGETNGVSFAGPQSSGVLDNFRGGVISSDSRAVDIQGNGVQVRNLGDIVGTGNQRNGTVYTDGGADNFSISNFTGATIDAGKGNQGSGISLEIGDKLGETVSGSITNGVNSVIQGRGQAASNTTLAGDGIVLRAGAEGTTFQGDIRNSGLINSESRQGTTAAIRTVDGVGFDGNILNGRSGVISGAQNGIYFGNGEHDANVLNAGTISSGSRAINIDGSGVDIFNSGRIIGTGDQRNGTIYADDTASDFSINNGSRGLIDAGKGNNGAGISLSLDLDGPGKETSINNAGVIAGRGQAAANLATAGDGIRLEGVRVADGFENAVFDGTITNSGRVTSESTQGTTGAFRSVDGVGFQGELTNEKGGVFSGVQNGVYFGEGNHTGGVVNNFGTISSNSRAFNIDGIGLTLNNSGDIVGTASQRNGTVYADGTADDFTVNNLKGGVIDAGKGNQGSGFGAEIGGALDGANTFVLDNAGTIQGRGQAASNLNAAGDGVRIGNVGNIGTTDAIITNSGLINSESAQGTTAGLRVVDGVNFQGELTNEKGGVISGVQNGVYFGEGDHTGGVVNNFGTISSNSRAFNIDGIGLTLNNSGDIVGTASQRNGTVYADGTADDFTVNNLKGGVIDAGKGNQGSGFGAEIGGALDGANTFVLDNAGTIQGRGQAASNLNAAGDGVRIGNVGNIGTTDAIITNSGLINSESAQGTTAGLRVVDGVNFQGELTNEKGGVISGVQNGVYFGEGDHTGGVVNNLGTISSNSRAFNIDGIGLTLNNSGDIVGTASQRNGTVYADGTADDFTVNNLKGGVIDAGKGNQGSGFGAEIGGALDGANTFVLDNAGTIAGRGNAAAGTNAAGDGVRIGNPGNSGVAQATITNSGTITSEGANGTVAGIRFVDGVALEGTLTNEKGGVISGVQNGVYFGNADHSGGVVNNLGTISSNSRAFNLDGIGLTVNNSGTILGTGNQRNGTFYADDTAENFTLNNSGTIDAGKGNNGAGVSLSLDADGPGKDTRIVNSGTIQGQAALGAPLAPTNPQAGDGLRLEGERGVNAEGGVTFAPALFDGEIVNSGTISSGDNVTGSTAGFHAVNGVSFQGRLINSGVISGAANGVYFGNPVLGGGADHTGGVVENSGIISSDSRAFNLDGIGLTVNNSGAILGTGNQRNGTFYADGTADLYTLNNSGIIDAGLGNNGSAVSLQTGDVDFDIVSASIVNSGDIIGRGNAEVGNQVGDGVRLFSEQSGVTFAGNIENSGIISGSEDSKEAAGISIESGITLEGAIINDGIINGSVNAIDAREAGNVNIINAGEINGNILLGDGDDIVISDFGFINGVVDGGAGDDVIITGAEDNILIGGTGSDTLFGGDGIDTADFSDLNGVVIDLKEGTVIDNVGFDADVAKQPLINPNLGITNDLAPADIVSEAIAGNIYFNVHTTEFPSGEIRGQLEFVSDVKEGGFRVVTLTSVLNGAQEVPAPTDSPAVGEATVTFRLDSRGRVVSYETDLNVSGLVGELLPVNIGNGTLSPIHLHNAPIGVNGPVVVDVATDAGEGLVINADIDQLDEIENVILTRGDDLALAAELSSINGIVDGSDGIDTVDFSGFIKGGVVVDLDFNAPEGPQFVNFENVIGTDFNDVIAGNGGINVLTGGEGDDFFVFDFGNGNDVVTDFQNGFDLLDVSGRGVGFDLSAAIGGAQQIENDTLVNLGEGDSVLLQNFLLADLDATDFLVGGGVEPILPPVVEEEVVFEAPVFEAPVFEEEVFEAPVFEEEVVFEEPAFEAPVFEAPVFEEEVFEAPAFEAPEVIVENDFEPDFQAPAAPDFGGDFNEEFDIAEIDALLADFDGLFDEEFTF